MNEAMNTSNPSSTIKCWVELYSDNMFSWALYKTASKEIAEDLVQEVFLVAVQSFDNFKGESNPRTWLYAILNNKINDHYRASFRAPLIQDNSIFELFFDENDQWNKDQKPLQWPDKTTNLLDDTQFLETLQNCMKKLPDKWLSAVQLKYMEEKKGEVICQELGISPTNFWQILHRAKLQLRKCIELHWFKK